MYCCHFVRVSGAILILGFAVSLIGCGPNYKARAVVKGKVSISGKALTTGSVMFHGKDNLSGSASIDLEGNYVMNDAPLGAVTITVSVPKAPPGSASMMKSGPAMKAAKDQKSVDPTGSGKSISIMGAMPSNIVSIPEKYAKVDSSGLTYTVERGEHIHDLELVP